MTKLEVYHGLIFATFDTGAPPLQDYLGDMAYYLDLLFDRREGGTEIVGGVHKWQMNCNWKFAAENFAGDGYHTQVTHISASKAGFGGTARRNGEGNRPMGPNRELRAGVDAGNGHAVTIHLAPELRGSTAEIDEYLQSILPEKEQRLGSTRAKLSTGAANVFPTFSILHGRHTIRVWHPRGPALTEVWSWCIVDKAAPAEIKEMLRLDYLSMFGMAGSYEQDDGENWDQATASSTGRVARHLPFNYQMGLGKEGYREDIPGWIGPKINENQQRAFLRRWGELMDARSWGELSSQTAAY